MHGAVREVGTGSATTAPATAPTSFDSWASLTTGPIVVPAASPSPTTMLSAALARASVNASRTPGVQ